MASLFGRYEYAGELGRGASGRVLAVLDHATLEHGAPARRAIKVVPEHEAGRLVWEFARLCQVDHPRIAHVRELTRLQEPAPAPFALATGTLLLVEDFVEGQPLAVVVASTREAEARLALALRVGLGIAEGLSALHDVSLVHGDLKPDNVLCDAQGEGVTLIDLGFARPPALGAVPRGTPAYMAPELFAGVCTPAADVYALGALLHDCLAGEARTEHASGGSVPWRVIDPQALAGAQPAAVLQLLTRLLEHDHGKRPADAQAALALLLETASVLRIALPAGAARLSGLSVVHSVHERAARARTLPLVGHARALASLVSQLASAPLVLVRGARGSGRSRVVREAIRLLQEQRAQAGAAVPTWVDSMASLERLRDVDVIVWLGEDELARLPEHERAASVAKLTVRSVCIVLECPPGEGDPKAAGVHVEPLPDAELRELLARLLAPMRPSAAVLDAARERSLGYAGRLCELVCSLAVSAADLHDPRVWQAVVLPDGRAMLSAPATQVARALAWWGTEFAPSHAQRLLGGDGESAARAYDELRMAGLVVAVDGGLTLSPSLAHSLRAELPEVRGVFARRIAESGARARSGFAWVALDSPRDAREAFAREALQLRADGRSDAACALLHEARGFVDDDALMLMLADSERAAGRYQEALRTLDEHQSDAACLLRAELLRLTDQPTAARQLLESLFERPEPVAARARSQRARLLFDGGQLEPALADARQAVAQRDREAQLRGLEVEVLLCLTTGELVSAPVDALVTSATSPSPNSKGDAPELARSSFLSRAPARAHALRAQVLLRRGERGRALRDLRAALTQARALGEAHESATYALNLGLVELESGELGRALETLREAAQRLARVARTRDLARVLFNMAALALLVGDLTRCEAVLVEASRALGDAPDHLVRAYVSLVSAELSFSRGALEAAERELEAAMLALPAAARAARASLAARACLVALARSAPERAERHARVAREQTDASDVGATLELSTAELSLALARGDTVTSERLAVQGLSLVVAESSSFAERLRFVLATLESARASHNTLALAERTALARAWLERALVTLPAEQRLTMRAVPAYARVFASADYERERSTLGGESSHGDGNERWRVLVRASRRLFAESREARIAQRLSEIALELVHAERALVIAIDEQGEPSVLARSELSSEPDRQLGFSRSVVERVAVERQPLMTVEAGADVRLDRAASVAALQVRSVLCLELFGLHERAYLYLDDRLRPAAFGPDDLALLSDLAELARQALRTGEELLREGRRARRAEQHQKRLVRELARGGDARAREPSLPLIGGSAALARVISSARRVASSDAPVLITGESGTGKELLARFVHEASPRKARAFVAESCAAIPDTLLESALFGHVRGAFTGADRAHKGLFEAADGGTLLLDEVGEMSPSLQGKLLRVLQEGELRPLGSERTRHVDVRVLGATRRDLRALVATGRFREDLYYRLAVVTLELPALRERPEDIAELVAHFLHKHGQGRAVRILPSALRALEQRAWPGNVRELENEVRRALAFSDDVIELSHLSLQSAPSLDEATRGELDLHGRTDMLTRKLVREALERADGNVTKAALLLGISRFGLQKIVKRLQLSAK